MIMFSESNQLLGADILPKAVPKFRVYSFFD